MSNDLWAVLFDVDGTMVDNRGFHEQAWIEFGRVHGIVMTPEIYRRHIHSRPNDANIRFLFGDQVDRAAIGRLSDQKEEIYRGLYRPVLRGIDGLLALLEALAGAGVPCAAVSNSPPANVGMVLDDLGIRRCFRLVLDVSHVTRGKPDPEILYRAAEGLGVCPACCVLLEDSISGFGAAEAAGMPYVIISAGADPDELPRAVSARAVHRDFTSLTVGELRKYALEAERAAISGAVPRWSRPASRCLRTLVDTCHARGKG